MRREARGRVLRVLVVSDLHYDRRVYRGVDESRAWDWLLEIVDYHRPGLLVGLGDWGEAVSEEEFYRLLRRVRVWTVYGNHDRLDVLARMCNVLAGGYEPVLMGDGEVRVYGGLRFGAINGIVALRRRVRRGVPRKTPDEYVEVARRLRGRVDVLLMHDTPKLPLPEYEFMAEDERVKAVARAVEEAGLRLVLCGHLHTGKPYTVYRLPGGTLYVRVDSSQASRAYAIIDPGEGVVTVWVDRAEAERIPLPAAAAAGNG